MFPKWKTVPESGQPLAQRQAAQRDEHGIYAASRAKYPRPRFFWRAPRAENEAHKCRAPRAVGLCGAARCALCACRPAPAPRWWSMDTIKITAAAIRAMKGRGEKIASLTAYDYPTTKLLDEARVPLLL